MLLLIAFLLVTIACSHADPCAGQSDGVFLPSPDGDCSAYISCSNGVSIPRRCPDGFVFDNLRQTCNYPDLVTCPAADPCVGQPDNTFFPRPEGGCAAFYRCSQGKGVPLECQAGYYFDPVNKLCNFPDLVDCPDIKTTTAGTTTPGGATTTPGATTTVGGATTTLVPSTPGSTTTVAGTTASPSGTTAPPGPNPCEGLDGVFVADPNGDCQAYLSCSAGVAYPMCCPTGYFFDAASQMCNYWDMVACGDPADPCYGQSQFSFVPRPGGTCSSYYRCEYGVGIPLDCPDGLFFDETIAACNHPDLVECEYNTKPTAPTVETTTTLPITTTTTATTIIPTAPTVSPTTLGF